MMAVARIDHDRLFKELIETFFFDFVDLFLPEAAQDLDRDSINFLDKELFADVTSGESHEVDLVVKGRFKGKDAFFSFTSRHNRPAKAALPGGCFDISRGCTINLTYLCTRLPCFPMKRP
jgi:hypothetical protein